VVGVAWSDAQLARSLPQPECGRLMLFDQAAREMHPTLLRMVAGELATGRPVHWIDGSCRFEPTPLMPLLHWRGVRPREALADLHVCRGFTAHQLAAQIIRLADEAARSSPPERMVAGRLVVVSDLPRMFVDPQVHRSEGRAMLRQAMLGLRLVACRGRLLVIATCSRDLQPALPDSMHREARALADEIIRSTPGPVSRRRHPAGVALRLHHDRLHLTVDWVPLPWQQSSLLDFERGHVHMSMLTCRDEPASIRASDHPNGDNTADTARTASGA